MSSKLRSEDGIGLVSVMLALSLLAVFALGATSLAVNERRTAYNDVVHASAFLAADSGGEAAIAWLMERDRPPALIDFTTGRVAQQATLSMDMYEARQDFGFDLRMRRNPSTGTFLTMPRPGYDPNRFLDFVYDVDAEGRAGVEGESNVSVIVTKLTSVHYN
jgi:hypothetical protein